MSLTRWPILAPALAALCLAACAPLPGGPAGGWRPPGGDHPFEANGHMEGGNGMGGGGMGGGGMGGTWSSHGGGGAGGNPHTGSERP